jgi:hypothetical protein
MGLDSVCDHFLSALRVVLVFAPGVFVDSLLLMVIYSVNIDNFWVVA